MPGRFEEHKGGRCSSTREKRKEKVIRNEIKQYFTELAVFKNFSFALSGMVAFTGFEAEEYLNSLARTRSPWLVFRMDYTLGAKVEVEMSVKRLGIIHSKKW